MKDTRITHQMKLRPAPFEMIRSGKKTVELRLYDEKRRAIAVGDRIVFTNTDSGETLTRRVAALHRFDSFAALYKALPLTQCGYTEENVGAASPADMEAYYTKEAQEKYGVLGIALCAP